MTLVKGFLTFSHFAIKHRTKMNSSTRSQVMLENISGTKMYANLAFAGQKQPPQPNDVGDDYASTILAFLLMCTAEKMMKVMMDLVLIWYYLGLPSVKVQATYNVGYTEKIPNQKQLI